MRWAYHFLAKNVINNKALPSYRLENYLYSIRQLRHPVK
jgi:hypothetical protein